MKRLAMVVQMLVALAFAGAAAGKLSGAQEAMREHLGVASWFWTATGLAELVGVTGMVVGLRYPKVAAAAGLWISAIMVGAILTHLRAGDPAGNLLAPVVLLALALTVSAIRWRQVSGFVRGGAGSVSG